MLNDATCFKAVYIVTGYTDLRSGMDRLAATIESQTGNRPYVPDTLYLFCGRRADRIKGLVWEGDGWFLLYKRLSESKFQWPRNPDEVRLLTLQQFRWLMEGLTITPKKSVRPVEPPEYMGCFFVQNREILKGQRHLPGSRIPAVCSQAYTPWGWPWRKIRRTIPFKTAVKKPSGKSCIHSQKHGHYDGCREQLNSQNLWNSGIIRVQGYQEEAAWIQNIRRKN